jgi:hypothetical protein
MISKGIITYRDHEIAFNRGFDAPWRFLVDGRAYATFWEAVKAVDDRKYGWRSAIGASKVPVAPSPSEMAQLATGRGS